MEAHKSNLSSAFTLVTPAAGMFDAWYTLYEQYAREIDSPVDRKIGGTVWRWLLDGTHRVSGIVAFDRQRSLAGFAHFRPFPRTLNGNEACFLDDLFVTEAHRGSGLAQALVDQVCLIAQKRGWSEVRWVTDEVNERAQRLYNRIAIHAPVRTYRIPF